MLATTSTSFFKRHTKLSVSLFFIFFIPVVIVILLIVLELYRNTLPQDNVVGVGTATVMSDSAVIQLDFEGYYTYAKNTDTNQKIATDIKKVQGDVVDSLVGMGVARESVVDGSRYGANSLLVRGFTSNQFNQLTTITKQIQSEYPKVTVLVHYSYSVTPEIKLAVLTSGLADARKQAEAVAENQGRHVAKFNGSLCGVKVVDADVMFNPSTCNDEPDTTSYGGSDDSNPQKKVVGIVSADIALSLFK